MANFPRFLGVSDELDSLFSLANNAAWNTQRPSRRVFSPHFDLRETKTAYELHGELPGVGQKDVNIEFTDDSTLTIRGHTERSYTSGIPPRQLQSASISGHITEGGVSEDHKSQSSDTTAARTDSREVAKNADTDNENHSSEHETRFWVSERSIGDFQRSFKMPTSVDKDNVKASLNDGILHILVPKRSQPAPRKIELS